jgi:hypothetical protein
MIRYATLRKQPITLENLHRFIGEDAAKHPDPEVQKGVKDWLTKAKDRTDQLLAANAYIDLEKWSKLSAVEKKRIPKPISVGWAEVKYLYMELQQEKCAYCERKLAARGDGGAAEHDLEHFRPKNAVKQWSAPKEIDFSIGDPRDIGYHWLAFHLLNYCTACTKCNSGFKKNYFPIAGVRGGLGAQPGPKLDAKERPLLLYPLGAGDDDPEELIRFRGLVAVPPEKDPIAATKIRKDGYRNRRARVIIAFFDLNQRSELLWGRAEKLRELEKALADIVKGTTEEKLLAEKDIKRLIGGFSEHTACVKGMIRLYQNDVPLARKYFDAIRAYLDSKTPTTYLKRSGQFVGG